MGVCATWTRDLTACTHAWHACVHKLIHALHVTWTRDLTTSNGFDTPLATVYICTRTCMCMATRICVYVYVSKYVCMYVCMSVCTPHACMRPCMCTYVHVYCTYTHTQTYRHTDKHAQAHKGSGSWVWVAWQVRTQNRDRWR